jgi:hypothetical protein
MHPNDSDIIMQFIQLSKTFEKSFNIKQELFEAHNIYLELLEVRKKLAEAENSFPKLN